MSMFLIKVIKEEKLKNKRKYKKVKKLSTEFYKKYKKDSNNFIYYIDIEL